MPNGQGGQGVVAGLLTASSLLFTLWFLAGRIGQGETEGELTTGEAAMIRTVDDDMLATQQNITTPLCEGGNVDQLVYDSTVDRLQNTLDDLNTFLSNNEPVILEAVDVQFTQGVIDILTQLPISDTDFCNLDSDIEFYRTLLAERAATVGLIL